jgi:hypothetical protein
MSATGLELSSVGALMLMLCDALTADSGPAMPLEYTTIPYQMTLVLPPQFTSHRRVEDSGDRACSVRREWLVPDVGTSRWNQRRTR